MRRLAPAFALALALLAPGLARAEEAFYLKPGDRVVFYGDSITDQRLYTVFTEDFVLTRYPRMAVDFIHSGWGGDRVTGGGGGPIDRRLKRDVIAYKPTVMTIMLGMNDASYRPFDKPIFETYAKGYEHIVSTVKQDAPGIRLTLIVPSPFDDVTRKPAFEGGYNSVLLRYGDFVKELAKKEGATVADLNTSVVAATKKALELDPKNAEKLNPDRVHPGPGGQLLMAAALLKAWHAPALVSSVHIDLRAGGSSGAIARNASTGPVEPKDGGVTWRQTDESLPYPLDLKDPIVGLALKASDFVDTLDQQLVKVEGLKDGDYTFKIDGETVGDYAAADLAKGVNIATKPTPMLKQALRVHDLTKKHDDLHFQRWRVYEVPMENGKYPSLGKLLEGFDALEADFVHEQRVAAQPLSHGYEVRPKK